MDLTNSRRRAAEMLDSHTALRAQRLRTRVIANLSTPGSGRTYQRRGHTHQASAPGDGPAVDTGRLRQSIAVVRIEDGHYRVGTNVKYAPFLEFGTRRLAPRPFLRPALEGERAGR